MRDQQAGAIGQDDRLAGKAVSEFQTLAEMAGFSAHVDAPANSDGEWFFDVTRGEFEISVSWSKGRGFGLYTAESGYGDQPNELYLDASKAIERLWQLHASQSRVGGLSSLWLSELRQLTHVSQSEVARIVDIKQSAVSRFEGRGDVRLRTLISYLAALGGRLEMRVHFDRMDVSIDLPTE
jgi:hypothetical protein